MDAGWLDLVVAAVIGAGALRGFKRGLVREGMALAGLALGLALATRWHSEVTGLLRPFIGSGPVLDALAYLLVVLAVLEGATLLTVALLRLRRVLLVGWLDRLGGAVFGAGQGAVLAAIGLILLLGYPVAGLDQTVKDSALSVELLRWLSTAMASLPPELAPVAGLFHLPRQ